MKVLLIVTLFGGINGQLISNELLSLFDLAAFKASDGRVTECTHMMLDNGQNTSTSRRWEMFLPNNRTRFVYSVSEKPYPMSRYHVDILTFHYHTVTVFGFDL